MSATSEQRENASKVNIRGNFAPIAYAREPVQARPDLFIGPEFHDSANSMMKPIICSIFQGVI
jgi:hypothetical protein